MIGFLKHQAATYTDVKSIRSCRKWSSAHWLRYCCALASAWVNGGTTEPECAHIVSEELWESSKTHMIANAAPREVFKMTRLTVWSPNKVFWACVLATFYLYQPLIECLCVWGFSVQHHMIWVHSWREPRSALRLLRVKQPLKISKRQALLESITQWLKSQQQRPWSFDKHYISCFIYLMFFIIVYYLIDYFFCSAYSVFLSSTGTIWTALMWWWEKKYFCYPILSF